MQEEEGEEGEEEDGGLPLERGMLYEWAGMGGFLFSNAKSGTPLVTELDLLGL